MSRVLLSLWLLAVLAAGSPAAGGQERVDARKLYVAKCAKCHKFYEPKNYSDGDWSRWMTAMSRKSKLKPEQERALTSYLEEYRAGRMPGKPQDKPK